tara:strand:- start:82 stop:885 length:804 start_codon:yes stop_codon:yes gene_type:complete
VKFWFNGEIFDSEDKVIAVNDRAFMLGDGLFETVLARDSVPLRLSAHLQRLRQGAELIELQIGVNNDQLSAAFALVLDANKVNKGVLRLTASRGTCERGLLPSPQNEPCLAITVAPVPPFKGEANAIIATSFRRDELSPLSRCKTLSYLGNIVARQEAESQGANEALLLNTQKRLAEATISNLFLVVGNRILTPPVTDGALPGTIRGVILAEFGAEEKELPVNTLDRASEGFLTNSLGIRPLLQVDGKTIGNGTIGPITSHLMSVLP